MLEIPLPHLKIMAKSAERFYRPYPKKKAKGERIIHNPQKELKAIQQRINKRLLQKFELPYFIVGGVKGKKLKDHLILHLNKAVVVTLDIKECFPNITAKAVYNVFIEDFGAFPATADLAVKLTTYRGYLPLGAPTSSTLANIVLLPYLLRIRRLAENYGFALSQFVDDSALSGKLLPDTFITRICNIFSKGGFTIKKIKVMPKSGSQEVTKRIVNQKPGVLREEINKIRSAVNKLRKMTASDPLHGSLLASVKGRINGIKDFHPKIAEKFMLQLSKA